MSDTIIVAIIAAISGIGSLLLQIYKEYKLNKNHTIITKEEFNTAINDLRNSMATKDEISALKNSIEEVKFKLDRNDDDTVLLLRDKIYSKRDKYITAGYCSSEEKQSFSKLYSEYIAYGHNHVPEQFLNDIMALPENNKDR